MEFRVGQGTDVHRLVKGRDLILGGVKIPSPVGLIGHSDADVLTHAIIDALLGAAGKSDIGTYFPSDDAKWKDAVSLKLLAEVRGIIKQDGWEVANIDSTVLLEEPKLKPHIPEIKKRLSEVLSISVDCCGAKAGTMEQLGFVGKGEGVMAQAVALLKR